MRKKLILPLLIISVLLTVTTVALALPYGVGGSDWTMSNPGLNFPDKYYWTGTLAGNYIMGGPSLTYPNGEHVNSVYMRQDDQNFTPFNAYEIGWFWDYGASAPRYFAVFMENRHYGEYDLGVAPKNSNHSFEVQVDNGTAKFIIDGVVKYSRHANFNQGISSFGSERKLNGDSDYAHFWSLQKRNHSFAWNYWQNLQTFIDADTAYGLKKISNTEAKVQTYNYQPFYRLYNGSDHFYTMSDAERWSVQYGSYSYDGVQGYMANYGESYYADFYRSYNPSTGDHFYTTSWAEAHSPGYSYEGVAGYIYWQQVSGTIPLYRSFNPGNGDHFYTTLWAEAHSPGYSYDGVAGYIRNW